MDKTLSDWLDAVPVLLAAARTGSATAAARTLGTTTATALRRLSVLEDALDTRLFDRTPGGLIPTVALEPVLPWAEQIEAAAFGLSREVKGFETKSEGTVRLALLPALSSRFIAPSLPALRSRYPNLVVELAPAAAIVDLVRREADLALRAVSPDSGDLIVKRVATFKMAVVAAPGLIDEVNPQTLSDMPWITWDRDLANIPEAIWLTHHVPDAKVVLRCSELETQLRAAQAGIGAMLVGEPLAAVAGELIRVPAPTPVMPESPLYLVAHRALRPVPRVAAVWEWVLDSFERWGRSGQLTLDA